MDYYLLQLLVGLTFLLVTTVAEFTTIPKFYQGCAVCPVIEIRSSPPDGIFLNRFPAMILYCYAKYPVEWDFHFDEDQSFHTSFVVEQEMLRDAIDIKNVSTYNFTIFVAFRALRINFYPNFTCSAAGDASLLSRLVTHGNETHFSLQGSEVPNDYQFRNPHNDTTSRCEGTIAYSKILNNSSGQGEVRHCSNCVSNVDGDKLRIWDPIPCDTPSFCRSIYPNQQKHGSCVEGQEPFINHPLECDPNNSHSDLPEYNFCYEKLLECPPLQNLRPSVLACHNENSGKVRVADTIFYSLKGKEAYFPGKHFDLNDMTDIIIRNKTKDKFYKGQVLSFKCMCSRFFFSFGIWYSWKWNYGSRFYSRTKSDIIEDKTPWKQGTVIAGFVHVSLNHTGFLQLYCHCPVHNSWEWINSTYTLQVLENEEPKIVYLGEDSGLPFTLGEDSRKIICRWRGAPVEKNGISWESTSGFQNLSVDVELDLSSNTSSLHFHRVTTSHSQNYTCIIRSFVGEDRKWLYLIVLDDSKNKNLHFILGMTLFTIAALITFTLTALKIRSMVLHYKNGFRNLTSSEVEDFLHGKNEPDGNAFNEHNIPHQSLPYDETYELRPEDIQYSTSDILGFGEFGIVFKGKVEEEEVAVKTLKDSVEVSLFKAILTEMKILGYIGNHPNVVRYIGCCTKRIRQRKLMIVMEFCPEGSLESFLRRKETRERFISSRSNDTPELHSGTLLRWAQEVGEGLEFLHSKDVIHVDLAVRNVLLDEHLTAKLTDFGLSRYIAKSGEYIKQSPGALPWRHMAPESLSRRIFSTKSDVWGFGVLLWEIFSLGRVPYEGTDFTAEFVNSLENGMRLEKPEFASGTMYNLMLECWDVVSLSRPSLTEVLAKLTKIEILTQ